MRSQVSNSPPSSFTVPRFLLGAALLFWGYMMDQMLLAVVMGLMLEAAHWTKLRWDFQEPAFLKAWHLCVMLTALAMALIWIDGGNRINLVPRLLGWSPMLLFPVQFTQSYGLRDRMPLLTFSIFARRRWERNRQLGFTTKPTEIHFGNVYVVCTILASVLTQEDKWFFLAGLVLFAGWLLLARSSGRKAAILSGIAIAGIMAVVGQFGLHQLERYLTNRGVSGDGDMQQDAFSTAIGKLGEIKQSTEIKWRVKTLQGETPKLLHTAIYNQYYRGRWSLRRLPEAASTNTEFNPLGTKEPTLGQTYHVAAANAGAEAFSPDLPRISLRGSIGTSRVGSTLPVPGNLTSLTGFDVDSLERNAVATIRIFPKDSVIDGLELWKNGASPDLAPWKDMSRWPGFYPDLKVEPDDLAAVHATGMQLGLKELSLEEKKEAIRLLFKDKDKFKYTRHLNDGRVVTEANALSEFLTTSKAGHCEYFATAATLILRDAGVPARYVVGFSVKERDFKRNESVLRGTHSHAWCRVWDEKAQRWDDFDPTPPDWLEREAQPIPWYQGIVDWIQRVREDFFLWRNKPGNRLLGGSIIGVIALIGLGVVARSLWRSRQRVDSAGRPRLAEPATRTPLHDLEPAARKLLGERPPGVTFGDWLRGLRGHLSNHARLEEAIVLHQRLRFDPDLSDPETRERLSTLEQEVRREISRRPKRRETR